MHLRLRMDNSHSMRICGTNEETRILFVVVTLARQLQLRARLCGTDEARLHQNLP